MKLIEIYTTSTCPFCVKAKQWLTERGYEYKEVSLDDPVHRQMFKDDNPGLTTVPQIFVVDTEKQESNHIGGSTDLYDDHPLLENLK